MKLQKNSTILAFALMCHTAGVFAQKSTHKETRSSLSTSIGDDDKELTVRIDGTINGKRIHFDKTYDLADGSNRETKKRTILRSISDSLGIELNVTPVPPVSPISPVSPVSPMPPVPPLPPLEPDDMGVYSENVRQTRKPHFIKNVATIRITCEECPTSGEFSLISDDNNTVIYSFDGEDKNVFPLIFKAKAGRYTFKQKFDKQNITQAMTLKAGEVKEMKIR